MRIWRPSVLSLQALVVLAITAAAAVVGAVATPVGGGLGVLPAVVGAWWVLRRPLRRWRVARRALPDAWRRWVVTHVPLYQRLHPEAQRRFERDVQFFLDEQRFEAVGGVELTDTLQVSVAAGAALLLHGRPDWEWPASRTILIYPDRFDDTYHDSAWASFDGMIHAQGPIILSKKAVEQSWAEPGDGDNVVLHELAHVFDLKQTQAAGLPSLLDPQSTEAWQEIVRREMQHAGEETSLLRPYAATNPGELFAVAVENFFERPEELRRQHAELYEALVAFFQLDPRRGKDVIGEGA